MYFCSGEQLCIQGTFRLCQTRKQILKVLLMLLLSRLIYAYFLMCLSRATQFALTNDYLVNLDKVVIESGSTMRKRPSMSNCSQLCVIILSILLGGSHFSGDIFPQPLTCFAKKGLSASSDHLKLLADGSWF